MDLLPVRLVQSSLLITLLATIDCVGVMAGEVTGLSGEPLKGVGQLFN